MTSARGQAAGTRFDAPTERAFVSRRTTHVHLLRHGDVVDLERRVARGQLDVALSDTGRAQGLRLVAWLARAEPRPDRLFTSDLRRCAELADALGEAVGLAPEHDARLREQSLGDWQGRTWEELQRGDPAHVRDYWDDYVRTRPPGGESFVDLGARVDAWWDEIAPDVAGGRIAVVTHIGVIRALTCRMLGVPLADALRFAPATASHTALIHAEAGGVLASFGERPWID